MKRTEDFRTIRSIRATPRNPRETIRAIRVTPRSPREIISVIRVNPKSPTEEIRPVKGINPQGILRLGSAQAPWTQKWNRPKSRGSTPISRRERRDEFQLTILRSLQDVLKIEFH